MLLNDGERMQSDKNDETKIELPRLESWIALKEDGKFVFRDERADTIAWKSGVYDNGLDMSESTALQNATSLPRLFKEAGYYTASYGKVSHGWDVRADCDDHIGHDRDPVPPNAPLTPVGKGEQDWGPTHLLEEEMHDTMYADAAIKQLQKKHDKPFLIACGLFHPHMPWYVLQKYFDMFPLDEVTTPELMENDLDDVPPLGRALTASKSKFVEQVLEHGLHKQGVQGCLATTAYADALEEKGTEEASGFKAA